MAKIGTKTTTDLIIQIGVILSLLAVLFLGFFFLYLPFTTHHGQTITVPDLVRMNTAELEDFLNDHDLRYEVSDCTYVAGAEPLTVVSQYPKPGFKVKEGRKLYITITTENPPMIPMPKLVDQTYVSAQYALASNGLQMGKLKYVPDLAQGTVLQQLYEGKEIAPGTRIAKGSKVDIVVGDGLGNTMFAIPDVVGKPRDEAEMTIRGSNLQVGTILPVEDPDKEVGTVVRQNPAARPGSTIRVGDVIDLWVVGPVENDDSQ